MTDMTKTQDDFNRAGSKMSKDEIKSLLIERLPFVLKHILPRGVFRHSEFHVGDVQGNSGKSLVVELTGPKAGLWQDFATKESGDILTLWAKVRGMDVKHDFREVIASIQDWLGIPNTAPIRAPTNTSGFPVVTEVTPIAEVEREPNATNVVSEPHASSGSSDSDLGALTGKWDYLSEAGELIVTVSRYDTASGKQFRPYDARSGKYQKPAEPRPLYNLPGIKASQTVVIVEGEKAAQALIDIGICATTAMFGANAPIDATDWSPLLTKNIIIWPDNDIPGKKYAKLLTDKLKTQILESLSILIIPKGKPSKWDARDAVDEGVDIHKLLEQKTPVLQKITAAYSADEWLDDQSPTPDDIIGPRILTSHGLLVFGGAPKIGKSDLLLSWLAHLAAGRPFLGMTPARPLKIFYMQAEVEYHYFKERMHALRPDTEFRKLMGKNLVATPQCQILLDKNGVELMRRTILCHFPSGDLDIIAIDPLRQVFDGGENKLSENDNGAMGAFLQNRISALRDSINMNAGVILIHHTRKLTTAQLKEESFNALAGAGSLRCYFSSGILMYQPDEDVHHWILKFELRNGRKIRDKHLGKVSDKWCEVENESDQLINPEPLINKKYTHKLDAEHKRKQEVIIKLIHDEARKGNIYTMNQFCEAFSNRKIGIGGIETIRSKLNMLATDGYIRFFHDADIYGLPNSSRTKFGYLCVEGMELITTTTDKNTDKDTNNVSGGNRTIYMTHTVVPTHFKCRKSGEILPLQDENNWQYFDEKTI